MVSIVHSEKDPDLNIVILDRQMANDSGNEDNWLYGDSNSEAPDAAEKSETAPAEELLSDAPPGTESENAVS